MALEPQVIDVASTQIILVVKATNGSVTLEKRLSTTGEWIPSDTISESGVFGPFYIGFRSTTRLTFTGDAVCEVQW